MAHDLTIHETPIDGLHLLPGNPRQGDIGAVSESMRVNGVYQPIIVNRGTHTGRPMEVIAGNHRTQAARALGHETIPAIILDVDDDTATRIALADNRTSDLADYDTDALIVMLQSLPDLTGTGYDGDDLDDLLASYATDEHAALTDLDETPPPPTAPIARPGDVFTLGEHRIVCGDSSSHTILKAAFGDTTIGCVLTDPPYGIDLDTDYSGNGTKSGREYRPVAGDAHAFDATPLRKFFTDTAEQFWWGANYYRRTLTPDDRAGSWLVWDKRTPETDVVIGSGFELCWSATPHKQDLLRHHWTNFNSHQNDGHRRAHPTEKPVTLLTEILNRWAPAHCTVADPFAGSGSLLLAAMQTGRTARLIELDPGYVDVICRRWQEHTGETPTLDGKPVDFTIDH